MNLNLILMMKAADHLQMDLDKSYPGWEDIKAPLFDPPDEKFQNLYAVYLLAVNAMEKIMAEIEAKDLKITNKIDEPFLDKLIEAQKAGTLLDR